MTQIRKPQQERSIETKKKIIGAGYKLFGEKGFYKTNTVQIAKEAGVSTGIVYGYFNNKKDILIEVIEIYNARIYNPVFDLIDGVKQKENLENIILKILKLAEKLHIENLNIHNELHAVAQIDEDINKTFINMEDAITEKFVTNLQNIGYKNATNENVHMAMNLIQSFVHEVVYDKHEYLNYNKFRDEVVKLLIFIFAN